MPCHAMPCHASDKNTLEIKHSWQTAIGGGIGSALCCFRMGVVHIYRDRFLEREERGGRTEGIREEGSLGGGGFAWLVGVGGRKSIRKG